ncbi:AlbA family DNA-binding domain-containing protein [Ruegeria arenilitoris]|uniref:AlbA family DNA-binding domain-containing protein n=1 Tax=Ruegeria arenilitoris TaxID=1173585 RepID=UPI00148187C1|nr:RNA-binding domain-containing protein [Ruegeria arenilitoris]
MTLPETFNPPGKPIDSIDSEDLLGLKDVHEGWYVHYKRSPLNARSTAKAISAMANTYGGWVFIAVEEESKLENVAGSLPDVAPDEADKCVHGLRQSAAEQLNRSPFFLVNAVNAPGCEIGNKVIRASERSRFSFF